MNIAVDRTRVEQSPTRPLLDTRNRPVPHLVNRRQHATGQRRDHAGARTILRSG